MKYSSFTSFKSEYFKNDSTMDLEISYRQRMSEPIRLRTILQIVQLTAFRTYNSTSKSKAFKPVKVSLVIFERP